MATETSLSNEQRIWQVVSRIPAGAVASYGQVAELAGLPRAARLVGRTLKKLPEDTRLPWHRVINSQGKIAFAAGSPPFERQRTRLLKEGIQFHGDRIPMSRYRWQP